MTNQKNYPTGYDIVCMYGNCPIGSRVFYYDGTLNFPDLDKTPEETARRLIALLREHIAEAQEEIETLEHKYNL